MTYTFADAYRLARPLARAGDRAGATALLCNLLWHVEKADGGFLGRSDQDLHDYCDSDSRLDYVAATAAMHAPGEWPTAQVIAFPMAPAIQQTAAFAGSIK